jgi:hypothetical protein
MAFPMVDWQILAMVSQGGRPQVVKPVSAQSAISFISSIWAKCYFGPVSQRGGQAAHEHTLQMRDLSLGLDPLIVHCPAFFNSGAVGI